MLLGASRPKAAATRPYRAAIAEGLQRANNTVSIDDIPVAPLRDGPEADGDALAICCDGLSNLV